jgi:two-component system cell cycle sensor histidine kinase/response regulator CckA
MKRLIQIENDQIVRQITLEKPEYTLGRGKGNDIIFNTPKVSRRHAVLVAKDDSYHIIDKNSTNHVFVNGEQIAQKKLISGDEIHLSIKVRLLYLISSNMAEEASSLIGHFHSKINKNDFLQLKRVTSQIISLDSLENILRVVLSEVIKNVGAQRGFIALTNAKGDFKPDGCVVHNLPLDHHQLQPSHFSYSTVQKAVRSRRNVYMLDTEKDHQTISQSISDLAIQAVMCSPLTFGDRLVGVLYVDSGKKLIEFKEMERFYFTILADHAAIAIQNAKRFSKKQAHIRYLKEEVRETGERYRQLIEISPDAIIVHSQGKVVYVNPAAVKLVGAQTADDIINSSILDIVHPHYREIVTERIDQQTQSNRIFSAMEEKFLRLDGQSVNVEVTAASFYYKGRPSSLVIARDIGERKKMEQELHRTQKLESLSLLAGGIAHDFNNLLTAIQGNINIARILSQSDKKILKVLSQGERAILRATNLTQQLLAFSKNSTPKKKTIAINTLIADAAEFVLRGAKVRCEFSIPNDLWWVEADEGQISQVINNLVINADQSMPDGGIITVQAENIFVTPKSTLPLAEGRYVKIIVKDYGIGIPKKFLQKIFDPYFTTKQKGSGLGIAVSYSIIKKHDGYISIESELGAGTTVFVYLPASEKKTESKAAKRPASIFHGEGRILMMEDQEELREVTGQLLKLLGYDVSFARDGLEALNEYKKALKTNHPFSAVLVDLTIPGGMGGKEAIQKLRAVDPHVKAIVSSGYANDPIIKNYSEYGFCDVITKPYGIEILGEKLGRLLNRDG